jgi:hypothetical protein
MSDQPKGDELARKQWQRYQWMRDAGHDDYITEADENEGFYTGDRQWEEADRQELEAAGRPAETINEILPKINNITGQQIAAVEQDGRPHYRRVRGRHDPEPRFLGLYRRVQKPWNAWGHQNTEEAPEDYSNRPARYVVRSQ